MCLCFYFFFFKQKTAYEMRISDWSSDVCSSDLAERGGIELRDHLRAIINNSARRPALVFAESFREKEGVSVPDNAADRRSARGSGVRCGARRGGASSLQSA